ncbi:MAG TPA: hypothetical protein P5080_01050 [Candidatus Paceibacterota bacterium]|nr:hypothetical protein [Candidatus Pacearchaeota archaeon]HRZ50560.1 hypothetical protein [Candidatus Paceibacterota bacterium]HSA36281.1 hypothetical protein [Candidatus Paceibacterota bacterium]
MNEHLPPGVAKYLWSSDLTQIDLKENRERIILNVLNLGDRLASDWLLRYYPRDVITKTIIRHGSGELSPKSLNYWSFLLEINKQEISKRRLAK